MPTSLPGGRRCPDTRLRRLASRAIGESVGEVARTTIHDLLAAARARLERLEPEVAAQAAADGDAILVDIRSELQRAQDGTIDAAVWCPRNVLEWRVDPASSHADPVLSRDLGARLVLVCHEGYQSSLAAATLQDVGFARATDLAGGFQAWRAAGLPVRLNTFRRCGG